MIVQKPQAEEQLGKKLKGGKADWFLLSSLGTRKLGGPYTARVDAEARERQVQFFKHQAKNPLRKVAEMHPDDRAIVGSAIGSAAGFLISPAIAPLGAAAGHLAGKRLGGRQRRNPEHPGKQQGFRPIREIAVEIRADWPELWEATDPISTRLRDTVEMMGAVCTPEDVPCWKPTTTGRKLIGNFLANATAWHDGRSGEIKDELRRIWRKSTPRNPTPGVQMNPRAFGSRTHDWQEVLIQAAGKKVTRKQIRDYYWKNRKKIWPFLKGQTVLVMMAPRKNDFVLLRKRGSDGKHIKLTKLDGIDDERSFEYWVNRRVIEFHPVLTGKRTPILWLDIDIHAKTKAKKVALRAKAKKAFPKLRRIMRQFGVEKIYAYDSGLGGYHLEGPLKSPKGVDKLRKDFTAALKAAFADDHTFTTSIAQPGQIRLDTTTMHTLGSLRAPHSFTVAGGTKKRI